MGKMKSTIQAAYNRIETGQLLVTENIQLANLAAGLLKVNADGNVYSEIGGGGGGGAWGEIGGTLSAQTDLVTALSLKPNATLIGASNGIASLDAGGKVPVTQLPNSVMTLEGSWNASTNSPTLANNSGNSGMVYEVTVAGTTNFGTGNIVFNLGDWAVYGDNGLWYNSPNSNQVTSVFGRTGTVVSATNDYSFSQINGVTTAGQLPDGIGATKIAAGTVNDTKFGYLSGVTSDIQTQINSKAATVHTHAQSDITGLVTDLGNKQALATNLTSVAGLTVVNDNILQVKSGAIAQRTLAQVKSDLALNNVTNVDTTNASNISSGTLNDGRLSSSVALISAVQSWSAKQSFQGTASASAINITQSGGSASGLASGDIWFDGVDGKLKTYDTATREIVNTDKAQTLTNKTLTSPIFSSISNTGTLTLPTASTTLVGTDTADALTNKTISGSTNTLSAIPNGALTNSAVTIGSTSVSLGATATTIAGLTLTTPVLNGLATGTGVASAATVSTLATRDASGILRAVSFVPSYTTTATAAGTTTLTVASTETQRFSGTTTQNVVMPVTSTLVTGQFFWVQNNSTGTVTVQSSGANTIIALTANQSARVTCIGTALTTAADWNYEVYQQSYGAGGDLPVGSFRGDFGQLGSVAGVDLMKSAEYGKWVRASTATRVITANWTSSAKIDAPTLLRSVLGYFAGTWGVIGAGVCQTTTDFSTFANNEIFSLLLTFSTFTATLAHSDFANGRTVIITASTFGYAYSSNGVTWANVIGIRSANGAYTALSQPIVSGTVYSFWSSNDNARIHTTDHTTFTVNTNSPTTSVLNQAPYLLANGELLQTNSGSTTIRKSADNGVSWTTFTLPIAIGTYWRNVEFDGTTWFYVPGTGTDVYSSPDGVTWTTHGAFGIGAYSSVKKVNGVWVALRASTAQTTIFTSTAPTTTWTSRTVTTSASWSDVYFFHSKYFILSLTAVNSSADLSSWSAELTGLTLSNTFASAPVAYGVGNKLVLTGSSGIVYSYDAGAWTTITTAQQLTGLSQLDAPNVTAWQKVKA